MTKQTNVYITPEQKKALKKLAVEKDTNVSELIRQAVDEFLAKHEARERMTRHKTQGDD